VKSVEILRPATVSPVSLIARFQPSCSSFALGAKTPVNGRMKPILMGLVFWLPPEEVAQAAIRSVQAKPEAKRPRQELFIPTSIRLLREPRRGR